MILYVNERNEIKDVNTTNDSTLTPLGVSDDTFKGWSVAKICCYKVNVSDGKVTMMTPYVDSRLIEHIDQLGKEVEAITPFMDSKRAYIGDSSVVFPARSGKITAYAETDNGLVITTQVARNGNNIIVTFEPLDDVATVTISII